MNFLARGALLLLCAATPAFAGDVPETSDAPPPPLVAAPAAPAATAAPPAAAAPAGPAVSPSAVATPAAVAPTRSPIGAAASNASSPVSAPAPLPAPAAPACESPGEIAARVHYERAVRAELESRLGDASAEAQATLDAARAGPFADAARAMLERLRSRDASWEAARGTVSHRVELVTTATVIGIYSGALASVASGAGSQATAGLLMLGAGAGLGISLGASAGQVVPAADPPMLALGSGFGTFAALAGTYLGNSSGNLAGPVLGAELGGAMLGLGASHLFAMTGGDAASAQLGAVLGGAIPTLLFAAADNDSRGWAATALIGASVGTVLFPAVNQELRWSRSRWNLVGLGAGVGALFGAGILVLGNVSAETPVLLGLAGGVVAGASVAALLSGGLDADEPRTSSTALLELRPDDGLRLGSVWAALSPVQTQRRPGERSEGLALRALDARF